MRPLSSQPRRLRAAQTALLGIVIAIGIACSRESDIAGEPIAPEYTETGDLPALVERGYLRVIAPRRVALAYLPRGGAWLDRDRDLIEAFAAEADLELGYVFVDRHADLIPALIEGRGDVVVAGLTVTESRQAVVAFTAPVSLVREQVVYREGDPPVNEPADLAGRTLVVRRSSSYRQTAESLAETVPGVTIRDAPETMDTERILRGVAEGELDVSIADDAIVTGVMDYLEGLAVGFEATGDRPVAWAVRPDSSDLLEELNAFLRREQPARRRPRVSTRDLPGIREAGVLRLLTRNNATTYYVWRGKLLGFEYELARRFARSLDLRLEVVVPDSRDELIPWLVEGRGDLIAAGMTIRKEREERGVRFSIPYNTVSEVVVCRPGECPESMTDLAGRTFFVRPSSSYARTLAALTPAPRPYAIAAAPEGMETETIIGQVAEGTFDLTVADSHILDVEKTWRDDVEGAFPLGDPVHHGWIVREADQALLAAANAFFEKEVRGTFYNILRRRYFESDRRIRRHVRARAKTAGRITPYDTLIKRYASRAGYDWRLIASQMYQESRFNPNAVSIAGALGLMQMLPRTAKQFGGGNLRDPETAIRAGVAYLHRLEGHFTDPDTVVEDRIWLALASYNAGLGHVLDARRIAREQGLSPNRWFGHVEQTMPLLSRSQYARRARYGYCRGSEPVRYVREIRRRYRAYVEVADPFVPGRAGGAARDSGDGPGAVVP